MYKHLIRRVFDKIGLTDEVDDVIASNIDRFQFDEKKRQTIFLRLDKNEDSVESVIVKDPDGMLGFPEIKPEVKMSADFGGQIKPMRLHSYTYGKHWLDLAKDKKKDRAEEIKWGPVRY